MHRLIALTFLALLMFSCALTGAGFAQGRGSNSRPDVLNGAYEFVSEKIVLTEPEGALPLPEKRTIIRTSQDWEGQWLFAGGLFSRIMMKKARPNFLSELGYEATGGSYKVDGKWLDLMNELMLSPYERLPHHRLEFRFAGDTLTLIETWRPFNPHVAYGGTSTVVLRRARPNNGMHPTADSSALMRETPANQRFVAAGDAGR